MKRFNILVVFFLIFAVCKAQESQTGLKGSQQTADGFYVYGAEITSHTAADTAQMTEKYEALKTADTLQVKFTATVTEVCQSKGCWMKLKLDNNQETMVRFKDYGFFMPMDIAGKEVIVNGLAFVEEMTVEDQRHFAKDAGKTDNEIEKITDTKKTFGFVADGVLLKQ